MSARGSPFISGPAMSVLRVRRALLFLWLSGAAVPFVIVLAQTLAGRYGSQSQDAWSWLLASVLPTLGLMVAVTLSETGHEQRVSRFAVGLSFVFSLGYLALVWATILLQPFSRWDAHELFKLSHLWLAPMQALNDATLATVFLNTSK